VGPGLRHTRGMVALCIETVDGTVDLVVQGFWMSTRPREVVLRGEVPRKLEFWPGEGVLYDARPLAAAKRLEGLHAFVVVKVGTQELRVAPAHIEMQGVTLVIRATRTLNSELDTESDTVRG